MSDPSDRGVLYTEHAAPRGTSLASLWSYESHAREPGRQAVALNANGDHEYWLERSDPLLNTILPGTGVSLVVNFGDPWAAGRSLTRSALVPRVCVVGPVTEHRILRVGPQVRSIGAVILPVHTREVFGVPASELVDRIVPLDGLWPAAEVDALVGGAVEDGCPTLALRDELLGRIRRGGMREPVATTAPRIISRHGGKISMDAIARSHGLSHKQFAQRFRDGVGLAPKLFARITRFQSLVHALLSTDVSRWASVGPGVGFYDQAHMINEFRAFAGSAPTVFFQPHGTLVPSARVEVRGRPSEWVRDDRLVTRPEPGAGSPDR